MDINRESINALLEARLNLISENKKSDLTKIESYYVGYERCLKDIKSDLELNNQTEEIELRENGDKNES